MRCNQLNRKLMNNKANEAKSWFFEKFSKINKHQVTY